MTPTTTCVCCGAGGLRPHLAVAGEMGEAGLIPTTDQFGTALADIVRCPACSHMQLEPMPPDAVLDAAYSDAASEDYVGEEAGQRETARRVLAAIERHRPATPDPPTLLDLGCWVGFLLSEAERRGWQAKGVEPSAFASAYARERLGLDVVTAGLFDADLPAGAYSAVALGDVIEHLTVPGDALARIRELLVPDGVLWMALPDAGSALARAMGRRWWSVLPTHVQYFTRNSMRTLLGRSGFELVEVGTQPKVFTVGYYLNRIEGYSPAVARALVRGAERAGVAGRMWGPDFRDRMQVIARRV